MSPGRMEPETKGGQQYARERSRRGNESDAGLDRSEAESDRGRRRTLNLEWWVLVTVAQRLRKGELRGNLQGWGPREESGWEGEIELVL